MSISVIIPALNEAARIRGVIAIARRSPEVHEVIVVDDGSVDETAALAQASGARVLTSTLRGKGASMADGLRAATGDTIVYLDGDLEGLADDIVAKLAAPVAAGRADFVKARFSRSSGRVTTLTAKPLLATLFPELAHFHQPLGGIIAGRRSLFEKLEFENDYGVDVALLIDAHRAGARIEEVDIGHLEHDSQDLEALGEMAKQVVRVLLHRASREGRLTAGQLEEVAEAERRAAARIGVSLRCCGGVDKVALLDMDGTAVRERAVVMLAERTGRLPEVMPWLDRQDVHPRERDRRIAAALAGIPRQTFVAVAHLLTITPGARELVTGLQRAGYRVGLISDSYRMITETVRRRVFADFSVANLLRFRDGLATGEVTPSPWFRHPRGCKEHHLCKSNALAHLAERLGIPASRVLAVGDGSNDVCLVRQAGIGVAFEPKSDGLAQAASLVLHGDLRPVLRAAAVA